MQERKVREKVRPRDFYTGSLKPELHPVCQDNLSLTLHYFKRFTKYPPLYFQNMQKYTKDSWITQESYQHSKNPLVDLENDHAHTQSLRKIKPQC